MSLKFQVGQQVTQVVTPIVGEVVSLKIVDNSKVVYMVKYTTPDGTVHERGFDEDELS